MKHAVYAAYEMAGYDRSEIISVHETYANARKACRRIGDHFTGIMAVDATAKKGDKTHGEQE